MLNLRIYRIEDGANEMTIKSVHQLAVRECFGWFIHGGLLVGGRGFVTIKLRLLFQMSYEFKQTN